jgi:hypothetical protein
MANRKCPHTFYECIACGDVSLTKTRAEERLLKEALACHRLWLRGVAGEKFERAANAVARERRRAHDRTRP